MSNKPGERTCLATRTTAHSSDASAGEIPQRTRRALDHALRRDDAAAQIDGIDRADERAIVRHAVRALSKGRADAGSDEDRGARLRAAPCGTLAVSVRERRWHRHGIRRRRVRERDRGTADRQRRRGLPGALQDGWRRARAHREWSARVLRRRPDSCRPTVLLVAVVACVEINQCIGCTR